MPASAQVTSVDVSEDGNVLVVSISGEERGVQVGRSAVLVYSLITRQKLWTKFLFSEVRSAWLDAGSGRKLCFVLQDDQQRVRFVRLDEDFVFHASAFSNNTSLVRSQRVCCPATP
jgi:hypothetical protein